jgi:uncharacterized membrane protein YfcA
MMMGLGGAAGGFLGGVLIGALGTRFMYLATGITLLAGAVAFTLFQRRTTRTSPEIG